MTQLNNINLINTELENTTTGRNPGDPDYGLNDRGQFYMQHFYASASPAALLEGHISMFSGAAGGIGFAANYLLSDYASTDALSFTYSFGEIYQLSQLVARGFGQAALLDVVDNGFGDLSINQGIEAAYNTWQQFGNTTSKPGIEDYFPGNAAADVMGVITNPFPIPLTNADELVQAANHGSFLFGKSIEDFKDSAGNDLPGYTHVQEVQNGNEINYVVKHNGDRDGSGGIDFNDGLVVAVGHSRWDYVDNAPLSDLLEALDWPTGWEAIRDWDKLVAFRQQLIEGGEIDFEGYFRDNYTGDDRNFWGQLEALYDPNADIRNEFYYYDRNQTGTSDADFLYSGKGDDVVSGGGGNDLIDGGRGSNQLSGDAGEDTLIGGIGDDVLNGGADDDTLVATLGDDVLDGGSGTDTVDYSSYSFPADQSAINLATGSAFFVNVLGFEGHTLANIENVIGTSFDDKITGNSSNNILEGGSGNDTYIFSGSFGHDVIDDSDGKGVLQFGNVTLKGEAKFLSTGTWELGEYLLTQVGDDVVIQKITARDSAGEPTQLDANNSIRITDMATDGEALGISLGEETIPNVTVLDVSFVNVTTFFTGTPSTDIVIVEQGDWDVDVRGGGRDIVVVNPNRSPVYEEAVSAGLSGDPEDIFLLGNRSLGEVPPGNINPYIKVRYGLGLINLDDTRTFDVPGTAHSSFRPLSIDIGSWDSGEFGFVEEVLDSQFDRNSVLLGGVQSIDASFFANRGTDQEAASDDDTLMIAGRYNDQMYGRAGNDTLDGGFGADTLYGGAGNDTVLAGDGDDYVIGGSGLGDDSYDGGNGEDWVIYTSATQSITVNLATGIATGAEIGTDTLTSIEHVEAGDGDDGITGSSGNNQLLGGLGNDTLQGLDGSDILLGGDGGDRIYGDAGNDSLSGGNDKDHLVGGLGNDTLNGGGGNDVGDWRDFTTGWSINLSSGTANNSSETDTLISIEYVHGSQGDDIIYGDNLVNWLFGNDGNDSIDGGINGDSLEGGNGHDTLIGGHGSDTLLGGDGDDTLDPGSWIDTMTGGAGADSFVFGSSYSAKGANNRDVITDFSQSDGDVIDFSGYAPGASFIGMAAFSGSTAEIRYFHDGGNTIVEIDGNANGGSEYEIELTGLYTLTSSDFVL